MKLSLRGLLMGSFGAAALALSPLAVSPALATVQEITLNGHRIQILHSGPGSDATNFNLTFTNQGEGGSCEGGDDDAIVSGIEVALAPHSCEFYFCGGSTACVDFIMPLLAFDYDIEPFVAHTVGSGSYGTFFGLNPPGTVSARIVLLSRPPYTCGTWNLNVEATGLDLSSITANPISLWLTDNDASPPACFDIYDAIIGAPISRFPSGVRRGGRR